GLRFAGLVEQCRHGESRPGLRGGDRWQHVDLGLSTAGLVENLRRSGVERRKSGTGIGAGAILTFPLSTGQAVTPLPGRTMANRSCDCAKITAPNSSRIEPRSRRRLLHTRKPPAGGGGSQSSASRLEEHTTELQSLRI